MLPPESVRISVCRPSRRALRSCARASRAVSMWSAAVLEPALPGRSRAATGSPDPAWPWSTNATRGWWPKGLLPGRGGVLFLGAREGLHSADVHDHLAVDGRTVRTGQLPDPPRARERASRIAAWAFGPDAESLSMTRKTVGSEATGPNIRFGPQHADVGQTAPAECDGQGHIQQDLPRIVHGPRLAPRRECRRYRIVQNGLADHLGQQHRPSL